MFYLIPTAVFTLFTLAQCMKMGTVITSDLGKDFSIKCPPKEGIYGVDIEFHPEFLEPKGGYHEWKFTIFCRKFTDDSSKDEVLTFYLHLHFINK